MLGTLGMLSVFPTYSIFNLQWVYRDATPFLVSQGRSVYDQQSTETRKRGKRAAFKLTWTRETLQKNPEGRVDLKGQKGGEERDKQKALCGAQLRLNPGSCLHPLID